jgi:hypothetical protein
MHAGKHIGICIHCIKATDYTGKNRLALKHCRAQILPVGERIKTAALMYKPLRRKP